VKVVYLFGGVLKGSEDNMFGTKRDNTRCVALENTLIEYLDGRARPADRRAVEEHLAGCAACRARAEEFRAVFSALDDLPALSASPSFDATLRARIAGEPARRRLWNWVPSPRLAFAVTALVAMSVWMSSMPRKMAPPAITSQISTEADFGMIRDLPVLENYDVVSKFDALTELPNATDASQEDVTGESR
jgi:anti-sigma-K factor RskA